MYKNHKITTSTLAKTMRPSTFEQIARELESPPVNRRSNNPNIASVQSGDNCLNEVWPRVLISDWRVPMHIDSLLKMNVRYVLNLSHSQLLPGYPGAHFYDGSPSLTYMGIEVSDETTTDLLSHLDRCCAFISEGLALDRHALVIVNCQKGVSRSATAVAAYLMKHVVRCLLHLQQEPGDQGLPARYAVRQLRKSRAIRPNDGFIEQLVIFGLQQQEFRDAQVRAKRALDRMAEQRSNYAKSFKNIR